MSWQDEAQESLDSVSSQHDSWKSSSEDKQAPGQSSSSTSGHFIELQQETSEGSEEHQGTSEGSHEHQGTSGRQQDLGGQGMSEDEEDMELLAELR